MAAASTVAVSTSPAAISSEVIIGFLLAGDHVQPACQRVSHVADRTLEAQPSKREAEA